MAGFINSWSVTAADDATADSTINFAEGQLPGTLNNSNRALMASVASWLKDQGASGSVAGGTANAQTLLLNCAFTSLVSGQMATLKPSVTNTGAATLNVNGLGAKALRKFTVAGDSALGAGDIVSGGLYQIIYDAAANAAAGAWMVLNPSLSAITGPLTITGAVWITTNTQTPPSSAYAEKLRLTAANNIDTNILMEAYGNNGVHTSNCHLTFRCANGTAAVPTAIGAVPATLSPGGPVNTIDYIGTIAGTGYGTTGFRGTGAAAFSFCPTQLWTDTANGAQIRFLVTPNGATQNYYPFIMDQDGSFTINPETTTYLAPLTATYSGTLLRLAGTDASNAVAEITTVGSTGLGAQPILALRRARGTRTTPAAAQSADVLGTVSFGGYGVGAFNTGGALILGVATQTYTGTAGGGALDFYTTPNGSVSPVARLRIDQNGDILVNTNKFTVTGATGDTAIAGTLAVTGATTLSAALTYGGVALSNSVLGTGPMVLGTAPTITNTVLAGTVRMSGMGLGVAAFDGSGNITSQPVTGTGNVVFSASPTLTGTAAFAAATFSSTLAATGDFAINTNKFTVTASSGNTLVAGTLNVTGASTIAALSATSGAFSSTLNVTGASTIAALSATTGTFSGVVSHPAGTSSAPAIHFGTTNTGIYSAAAATEIDMTIGGATRWALTGTNGGVTLSGWNWANSATAIPAGGNAIVGYFATSTGTFGIYFGSGAPTVVGGKGSLYLRSDGSTTNDRAYINTNGSTTWTALTTAA